MGVIAILKSFKKIAGDIYKAVAKIDPDGGSNITVDSYSDAGDDSSPLPGDSAVTTDIRGEGRQVVVGYTDTRNPKLSAGGEKRIYGRDPSDGSVVNSVHLKADGSVEITNVSGMSIIMSASGIDIIGDVNITGKVDITGDADATGTITATTDVKAGIIPISLTTHTHLAGTPPGSTGPALP